MQSTTTPCDITSKVSSFKPTAIYVPDASVSEYQTNWSAYSGVIKPMSQKP